jgi:Zinc carboxypeptidase
MRSLAIAAFSLGLMAPVLASAQATNTQAMDATFAQHAKEWTTKPEFISPLVDHLPVSTTVPTPRDVLGHDIGAPNKLDYYEDLLKYYRALADKSPRVKIIETGKTEEGRPTVVVLISSETNINNLDTNRQNLAKLADPRGITPAQAHEIIAQTKPMYLALGGLHSAETGPPEMLAELAYRLLTEDSPLIGKIRENVIVAINPASDPDGRDRYTDWYYRNKIDDTNDLEPVPGAPYWGKYIFHDNNRDINYSGYSARNLLAFYLQWHPPIIHDLHESVPFLYIYSGQAPQNPNLDPIMYGELPWLSNFEMAQLTKFGMPGVWDHGFVDAWSPGYVAFMSSNHNGIVRFYETFGNGGATTELRHVKPVEGAGEDYHQGDDTTREWFRPSPPYKTVEWSMRDNTNFMETGLLTGLQTVSTFPQVILENFYKKSQNSIDAGRTEAPYAFVIPGDQPDMTRVARVVELLRLQGIEIGRATGAIKLKEGSFPAGSFIIKRNQPYGRLAKNLLEKQDYPGAKPEKGAPAQAPLKTYDDTAWTMGLMSHVKVVGSADLAALDIPVQPVDRYDAPGSIDSSGAANYAVLDFGSINFATLRYRLKDVSILVAEQSFTAGGRTIPAGSFIVPGSAYARLKQAVEPLGLTAVGLSDKPSVPTHKVALPRVAIYSTWGSTQNVGWVRFAFDQYETPYTLILKDDVKKGHLHAHFDVIVIPSQGRSAKNIVFDIPMHGKPLPYTKTAEFKNLGEYGSSPDIRGGMGLDGLAELRKFVEDGGTLITLGEASSVPGEFGLTEDIGVERPSKAFYAPGPIVTAKVIRPANPIFYGYTEETMPVRWATTALLSVPLRDKPDVLMEFPGGPKNVLSGLMAGAEEIKHRPAIVDYPVGSGQVVLFATNPVYRWQNFGEYRMLYNALFNYKDLRLGIDTSKPEAEAAEAADGSEP